MPGRSVLFGALLLAACAEDLGLDGERFACTTDADCIRGTVCDRAHRICGAPGGNAGERDASVAPLPDSGPDPGPAEIRWGDQTQPEVPSWFYTGLTAAEVDAKIAEHGARILDLETEGDDANVRYAVVLIDDGLAAPQWWLPVQRSPDIVAFLRSVRARPVDVEPVRTGTIVSYAAVLQRDAFSEAGRYVWRLGTATAIENEVIDKGYILFDADRRFDGGYTALMQPRRGEVVHWWRDAAPLGLAALVARGDVGLTHLDREESTLNFGVLTSTCPCVRSALLYDLDETSLRAEVAERHARILSFAIYDLGGLRRFAAIVVDNGG